MKYVKLKGLGFVLFEAPQSHAYVAEALNAGAESAGFVALDPASDKLVCFGESGTLRMRSDPGDTGHLRRILSGS